MSFSFHHFDEKNIILTNTARHGRSFDRISFLFSIIMFSILAITQSTLCAVPGYMQYGFKTFMYSMLFMLYVHIGSLCVIHICHMSYFYFSIINFTIKSFYYFCLTIQNQVFLFPFAVCRLPKHAATL